MATYNANAGAGSGYLRYDSLPMTKATTAMARVGDRGEGSWITVDGITTEARAGETVNNAGGGNGYCGGGQQGNAGGTDGGNGVGGTSEGQGTMERMFRASRWTILFSHRVLVAYLTEQATEEVEEVYELMESNQVATLKLKVTDMEEEDVALRPMEVTCFSDFLELLSWKSVQGHNLDPNVLI